MSYTLRFNTNPQVMVVGCGGTGGFVIEGLCRLLDKNIKINLVDPDRVEESNLGRQNFHRADLGRFKSQVLAERLSRAYGREITYCTSRIQELQISYRSDLTIGCVDNHRARKELIYAGIKTMGRRVSYCDFGGWYIDAGNGEHSGQVLIGNALLRECGHGFYPAVSKCDRLPLPQIQQPGLLALETKVIPRRACAEAVARDEQSPVINQMMAGLVLTFVYKLMAGTLGWMGAYIDLDSGSMSAVDVTPEAVSRITGLTVRQLEYRPRSPRSATPAERARLGV